jgi:acyl dehydratase
MEQKKTNGISPVKIEQLDVGYEFPPSSYELDPLVIAKYLDAVGRPSERNSPAPGSVSPMAVAAYTMKAVMESFALPPGSIHASQEFEFLKLVPVRTTIDCHGRIVQKVNRGQLHLLVIELEALNQDRERVLSGRATLVVPN